MNPIFNMIKDRRLKKVTAHKTSFKNERKIKVFM